MRIGNKCQVGILLLLLFLTSCATPQPAKIVKVSPPPIPKIEAHPEPILAAIPAEP